MSGSCATERQARDSARHIANGRAKAWQDGLYRLMEDACTAAGVPGRSSVLMITAS